MVARDPIRKVTLSQHPKYDEKTGTYSDPQVGSTVNIPEHVEEESTPQPAAPSSASAPAKKKKGE